MISHSHSTLQVEQNKAALTYIPLCLQNQRHKLHQSLTIENPTCSKNIACLQAYSDKNRDDIDSDRTSLLTDRKSADSKQKITLVKKNVGNKKHGRFLKAD